MRRGRAAGLLLLAALAAGACAEPGAPGGEIPYRPDRRDYAAFRAAHPDLLEPNYLPFMVHRIPSEGPEGDYLVFCRWSAESMPLPVYIGSPSLPEALQDEFHLQDPAAYVAAVEAALSEWEGELEDLVRFRRVARPEQAWLEIALVGEEAPVPDREHRVLGLTPLKGACRSRGPDPDAERLEVAFRVPELRIYLADRFGLLEPDQVEWIALHEIGHALGMRSHSPIPADLMYEVVRDRVSVRGLSSEDVNSFVSLYRLPNGAIFRRLPPGEPEARKPSPPPSGAPQLALAPHVSSRLGFAVRPPTGWTRAETAQGMVAVDGVTWDYSASFQVIVQRYPTIEAYLERYGPAYLSHGWLLKNSFTERNGLRAFEAVIEDFEHRFVEHLTFIESGDGRLIVVIADCPVEAAEAYRPWFEAALGSLEIWRSPGRRSPVASGAEGAVR